MAIFNTVYGGAIRTKIYDFQNNGDLGWTNDSSSTTGVCSIATNEGWQITRSGYNIMQGAIIPPSSVYGGILKKYKIYAYKSGNAAFGISNYNPQNTSVEYGRDTTKLNVNGNTLATLSISGEITMEMVFEDGGDIKITLSDSSNTYNYTSSGTASGYKTLWNSKNLGLFLGRWASGANVYIRKVEITTQS